MHSVLVKCVTNSMKFKAIISKTMFYVSIKEVHLKVPKVCLLCHNYSYVLEYPSPYLVRKYHLMKQTS